MSAPHPVDEATAAAIASASHFVVSLFHAGAHESYPLTTLAQAREAGDMMEKLRGGSRRAIVYAVTGEGRSFMIPRNFEAPTQPMEPTMLNPIRSYSDRSNARAAARRTLGEHAKLGVDFMLDKVEGGRFAWQPLNAAKVAAAAATPATEAGKGAAAVDLTSQLAEADAKGTVPAFLARPALSPEQKAAQATRMHHLATAAPTMRQISNPADKAAVTEDATMAKGKPAKAKPAKAGERTRYDWTGAEDRAKAGHMPPALDFSADTHKRFRPTLAELEKLAKAGDVAGLAKVKINACSSSPKAMDRWRKMVIAAIKAKPARK